MAILISKNLCVASAFSVLAMNIDNTALGMFSPDFDDLWGTGIESRDIFDTTQKQYEEFASQGFPTEMLDFFSEKVGFGKEHSHEVCFLLWLGHTPKAIEPIIFGLPELIRKLGGKWEDYKEDKEKNPEKLDVQIFKKGGFVTPWEIDLSNPPTCNKELFISFIIKLIKNSPLSFLTLRNCSLEEKDASILAEILKENSFLQCLDLYGNKIGEEGAKALADALKEDCNLKGLDVGHNMIGDKGASAFADALSSNQRLIYLDMGENRIGDKGAEDIARNLYSNKTLEQLGLGHNRIGDKGARNIAEMIKKHKTLKRLGLIDNEISDAGVEAFAGQSHGIDIILGNQRIPLKGSKN